MGLICLHIFLHCAVTMTAMIILDAFLVLQNHGDRKTGVLVMLVIEELCHIVALRYIKPFRFVCALCFGSSLNALIHVQKLMVLADW